MIGGTLRIIPRPAPEGQTFANSPSAVVSVKMTLARWVLWLLHWQEAFQMIDAASLMGSHDLLLVTLATLRYDVAQSALSHDMTHNLARYLPGGRWEVRHSPGNFIYAGIVTN